MAITANQLRAQIDLPTWEWLRFSPVAPSTGLSCSCVADNMAFNSTSGRYIYYLLAAANFWRYDTVTDTYEQLASPTLTVLTASSMRFAGAQGYYGRVIQATSTTLNTGLPFAGSAIGYRIRIISGKGAGQERMITNVSEPIVADFGGASAGAATSITDGSKNWGYTGTANNYNGWVGYSVRVIGGTGINQVRKVLYNTHQVITIADPNLYAVDPWALPGSIVAGTAGWTAPAAGSQYQIEYNTITVDTAWDVTPDNTSRYVIQSGGIWLASVASAANGGFSMQYYDVLHDIWYMKESVSNMTPITPTEISLERATENSTIWDTGVATSGTTGGITDTVKSWTVNQWAGYEAYIYSGTGRGQIGHITSNTATALTFSNVLGTAPDATSRYNIKGYDMGTLSSSSHKVVFDTTKTWTVGQWANYGIRIVSGTGAGQHRTIQANGTNSITVYDGWNIQPDNTSIYVIQGNSNDLIITAGANAETYLYRTGDTDMVSHGRILDEGIASIACAMLCDGTDRTTHVIYEQKPVAIASLAGTTSITATTSYAHQLKVGQWVSIRGVTSAANDIFNITGKVQITDVPSSTTFKYTPYAAGSGTYAYLTALGTAAITDASKDFRDAATGGSTTSVTFARATPSNINGWYVTSGTNCAINAQVTSGAGTTTLNLSLTGAGTPSGTITFSKYPIVQTSTFASGGGAGVFSTVMSGAIPAYVQGWLATGTNIGLGAMVTGGAGTTTPLFSIQCAGAPSGTITYSCPTNLPLPVTATYSSGTGTTIVCSGNTPNQITGWYVTGTNIANGTVVVSGAGTTTLVLSNATAGTPAGTLTFYPPTNADRLMYYGVSTVPTAAATSLLGVGNVIQLVANATSPTTLVPIQAITAVTAGATKFVIANRDMIGMKYDQQSISYLGGIALGTQSAAAFVDTNAFWATATGSGGSAGTYSFTLSAPGSILHNGWYVSGTNIPAGAKVVSGGGTTSITIDLPLTGVVSGAITFTAWGAAAGSNLMTNKRIRVLSSTGVNQEVAITACTPNTGTLAATITAAGSGTSSYVVLPTIVPGTGSYIMWQSNSSVAAKRGKYLIRVRGGGAVGFDKIDLTTDKLITQYTIPITETLTTGSMYAYDGQDRIYFTKDGGTTNPQRVYYLDLNTWTVHGAGMLPYTGATAGLGNRMEIFTTADGLKYLWVNRHAGAQEHFRHLIFY
jgi:hypothetical protein